jgi:hypothetical protein
VRNSKFEISSSKVEADNTAAWCFGTWNLELGTSASRRRTKLLLTSVLLTVLLQPAPLWACAACYGASDSPMAKGMNWGIFTLLGVVGCVLSTFATFIVFLAKKSAAAEAAQPSSEPTEKI